MHLKRIPSVPQWKYKSGYIVTPDGGLLYTGINTINYIPKLNSDNELSDSIKVLYTKNSVKSIDCDFNWNENKYFACLTYDDTVHIWNLDEEKIKMGHKVHTKVVENERTASETVCISFARNNKVLSIDSTTLVEFCILSNTFIKKNRVIPYKHYVTTLKCAPHNDNIFAAGTSRGLVMIVDLEAESVLHTVSGHTIEITSLSWCTNISSAKKRKTISNTSSDDIFDIYQVPDSEEFGVIRQKKALSSDEEHYSSLEREKEKPIEGNENFNFIEACRDLKSQILANKACNDASFEIKPLENEGEASNYDSEMMDNIASQTNEANSLSVGSYEHSGSETEDQESVRSEYNATDAIYLASASRDFVVCVWEIANSMENIIVPANKTKTKKVLNASNSRGHYCKVSWLNNKILAANCRNGGCITFMPQKLDEKTSFKRWRTFQEFTSLSPIPKTDMVWLIHPSKKIVCRDIKKNTDLLEFTCISSNIATMKEISDDMHTIAIACPDRRVVLLNTSSISEKCVKMETFSKQIYSSVLSLSCCPTNNNYLAFGTDEGRVGIINLAQPKNNPILLKPFSGKRTYTTDWFGEQEILVCSDNKVGIYKFNEKNKEAKIIKNIHLVSTISVRGKYLFVGKQSGQLALYIRKEDTENEFEQLGEEISIGTKYISEISWNSVDQNKFAVCSFSNKLAIFKFEHDNKITTIRNYNMNETTSGAISCRWSHNNENLLLTSGLDGVIRLWDVSNLTEDPIYLKQFVYPITCAMFSPIDDNIIICSGKGTTIELIDIREKASSKFGKATYKKMKDKPPEIEWASQISVESRTSKKKVKKPENEILEKSDNEETDNSITEGFNNINISSELTKDEKIPPCFETPKKLTILHLLTKEINKYPLECTIAALKVESEQHSNESFGKKTILLKQLFGDKKDVEELLNSELKNHLDSNTNSIGQIIIHQMNKNLKEDILERIKTKRLTGHHISLAPTISYDFWKKCCLAYINQLLETGLSLQAVPYLLALHEIKECIETLMKTNFYREAWVVAKMYLEQDDPFLNSILDKWIEFLVSTGNLEGAVLLCTLVKKYNVAESILLKRREPNEKVLEVIELLRQKCNE